MVAACEESGLENVCWGPSFRAGLIARLLARVVHKPCFSQPASHTRLKQVSDETALQEYHPVADERAGVGQHEPVAGNGITQPEWRVCSPALRRKTIEGGQGGDRGDPSSACEDPSPAEPLSNNAPKPRGTSADNPVASGPTSASLGLPS
jgi:hypothetical protein